MRFLADENIPRDAVAALREAGHDVAWVRSDAPGSADGSVLDRAVREGRVLVTFDKDFGELSARRGLHGASGVILLRGPLGEREGAGKRIAAMILARSDWIGHFSVIEPGRVRMRKLGNSLESAPGKRRG